MESVFVAIEHFLDEREVKSSKLFGNSIISQYNQGFSDLETFINNAQSHLGKVSVYDLAKNMGTSVAMLQRFYGQEMTEDRAVAVTQVNRQPAAKSEPNEKQSYPF